MFTTCPDSCTEPPPKPPERETEYDIVAATTVAPLYRCVGAHATVGGAVQEMHDEHTSDTGVPKYAGAGGEPPIISDDDEEFRTTCAPLLSTGKPVRLRTPPVRTPQRRPVAEENTAPVLEDIPPSIFHSAVTPAFSSPVTDWEAASAALMPLASEAGVMPVYCEMV
jgi:hypothetical protein